MKEQPETKRDREPEREAYVTPHILRIDLALTETLTAGCKLWGVCDEPPATAVSAGGS